MMQLHLPMRQRPILQIWFWAFLGLTMLKEECHQASLPVGSDCVLLPFVLLKKEKYSHREHAHVFCATQVHPGTQLRIRHVTLKQYLALDKNALKITQSISSSLPARHLTPR